MTLLWHRDEPIGICVFIAPPKCLSQRNRYFGLSGRWGRLQLQAINRQLAMLSRVVIHPTFRGAGIAHQFVRRSCQMCPYPWIETLTQMGHVNPFFERAGFVRVGASRPKHHSRSEHSKLYGSRKDGQKKSLVSRETYEKSRFSNPVYYVFDNRTRGEGQGTRVERS
jgi:hypothetical protein